MNEALAAAMQALDLSRKHRERGWQAHALRLLGDLLGQRDLPQLQVAEEHFRQALALAEELGMRPLVAHCHHGLGTLYTKIGGQEEARAELSAAAELYRAMEMIFWLTRAQKLLVQMT
jgi:tetratricopeptide (TPR) repeat protein